MFSKSHPIVLFVDRLGFSVFQDNLTNIPRFNFTPDLVVNLDVINKEQFINIIATFIQINKIMPSSVAIVLSDTIIYAKVLTQQHKDLGVPVSEDKEGEIQSFLENIPFEDVLAKDIKTNDGIHVIAVNKDLVMTIADAFANKGSIIEAIIPSFLYGPNINFTQGLTQNNAQSVLGDSEALRVGNLLTDQKEMISSQNLKNEQKKVNKKPQNLRQYILVGIFIALLIILAVAYLQSGASSTTSSEKMKKSTANTVSVPSVTPIITQAPIVSSIDLKSIKVKITQNLQSEIIATNLRNQLLKIGFQDISSETSGENMPEKSSIIFSRDIPADIKNNTIIEIKKILPNVSVVENQDFNFSVTILIGKS